VKIHNIGAKSARKFTVTAYEGAGETRNEIGKQTVPHLEWPQGFQSATLTVGFPYVPDHSREIITIVINEGQPFEEICQTNNTATRVFDFNMAELRAPRKRVGEIGGNVSAEIKRGLR